MSNTKKFKKMFLILMIAVLPGVLSAGCRGNLGWDRMDGPVGRQTSSGVHSARAM